MMTISIKRYLPILSVVGIGFNLAGCQSLNNGLSSTNQSLSKISDVPVRQSNTSSNTKTSHIKNVWGVSDTSALAWLQHNDVDSNDHGKLSHVDWFKFWSQQVHAGTSLAKQAYHYCMRNSWSTNTPGKNCEYFDDAYNSTMAQTSMQWGDQLNQGAGS